MKKNIIIFQHELDNKRAPDIEGAKVVTLHHNSKLACLMGISGQATHEFGETVYVVLSPMVTDIVGEDTVTEDQDVLTYRCHKEWAVSGIKSFIEGNSEVNINMLKS